MKKILIFVALSLVAMSAVTTAAPSSIAELLQDASFGYNDTAKLSVDTIDTSMITLTSPIIRDIGGNYVTEYRITYSPYLVEDLAVMDTQTLSTILKTKETRLKSGEEDVKFTLGVDDGLDTTGTYYLMVTPIDMYDDLGKSSQQVCFNLEQELYAIGDGCLTFAADHSAAATTPASTDTEHYVSTADMSLANISHTIDGNTVTLQWTAVGGNPDIDIFVFDTSIEKYVRLATVKMSDEKYTYVMKWDGEHIFRFVPLDGGKEMVYNVQAMKTSPNEPEKKDPVITTVPGTGPVENVLAILVLSGVGYFLYKRYLKRY
jgi:hypothetical protein